MTKKKVQYDLKAQKLLISSLRINEYHFVSHRKTTKATWNTLETFHEETDDVKQFKINTLIQQYMISFSNLSSQYLVFISIIFKHGV